MAHKHDLADLELNAPPNNTELNEPLLDTPDLEQNSRDSPNTSINSQDDLSVSSHSQNKSELQVSMDQMQQQVICVGGIKIAYEDSSCSSTLTVLYPTCRICQMSFSDKGGRLITPCRCKGSLKHVHGTCLRKWVEMRQRYKKYEFPDRCELCGYQYRKTKYIKCKKLRLPRMDTRDKVYHSVSLASLCIMMACLILSIYCILFDTNSGANKEKYKHPDGEQFQFTVGEMVTLCSGVIFFMSFILAMTVEIKSRHTIFEVIKRMLRYNTVWVIENYDKAADKEYCASDSNSSK